MPSSNVKVIDVGRLNNGSRGSAVAVGPLIRPRAWQRFGGMIALALGFLSIGSECIAQSTARVPRVAFEGCLDLEKGELERSLAVEISVLGRLPPNIDDYTLRITCAGEDVHISLRDPLESERMLRTISPDANAQTLASREVALAAAELLLAWNWVPAQRPEPTPTLIPRGGSGPGESDPVTLSHDFAHLFVSVAGHTTFRSLARAPFLSVGFGGQVGIVASSGLSTAIHGAWMLGRADRISGSVRAESGTFGMEASFLPAGPSHVHLFASLGLSASFVVLRGEPASAAYRAGRVRGWLPEAYGAVGPAFGVGPTWVALRGVLGGSLSNLQARVVGDEPVKYGGAFLGARLEVFGPVFRREDNAGYGVGMVSR